MFVIVDVIPQTEPHPFLASDEMGDKEMYWDGMNWTRDVRDALTWELHSSACDVATALKGEGQVQVFRAFLETTIELCGRADI